MLMKFILLQSYDNYISAHIAMGRLEEDGINCWLQDENTVTINPVWTNAVGGIKLMVAESQAERALELIGEYNHQQKATHLCSRCGSDNVELVTTPRKVSNWLSVLWGVFTFSYAMPVDKAYHCFNCGHEFEQKE